MINIKKIFTYKIEIIVIFFTLLAGGISFILCKQDYNNFCNGFLGNFLSDFIIATSFGFIFLRYYESKNHPHPILTANGEQILIISKSSAKNDGFVLEFGVLNKNRKALQQKDGFYHIFINKELSPEFRSGTTGNERFETDVKGLENYVEVHDENPGPSLYNSILTMVTISCKLHASIDKSTIYYFFNTEAGVFPKKVKSTNNLKEDIKTWGKLELEFK